MKRKERELAKPAQAEQTTTDMTPEVHFQLSSKNLTLTSEYFRGLMANNWKESSSSNDFTYVVTAEDWDEAALLIVMNITHCQTTEIPRKIHHEMAAKVAVIVDYYQCHKAVNFYAQTWIQHMRSKKIIFMDYGRELLLRLFISYVFLNAEDFREATKLIATESRGPIHPLGLPFPQHLIGELQFLWRYRYNQND